MLTAKHKTGLVFFPAFDWAISPTHPEREERLLYTQDQVIEEGLLDVEGIVELKPDLVTKKDIERVHFCLPDVWRAATESHFISAGGAKTVGMAVMEGTVEKGFALVRPPGHHAMRVVQGARGFCNINIEAVMLEYLRRAYGVERVAIVDTDCHHGDGTQDIYWHDPDTLFISIHQDGRTLYPGSGFTDEWGGPTAAGTTLNIPLPPGTCDEGFLYIIDEVVNPILQKFQPQLIINSAGQDNHYSDPITHMNFSAQGYAQLTTKLGAHIAVLEGGYAIEGALPYTNAGIIAAMAGLDYAGIVEPDYDPERMRQSEQISRYIERVAQDVLRIWHSRDALWQKMGTPGTFHQRRRSIYYDTDQINEDQLEVLRVCDRCSGVLKIESAARPGWKMQGVHIPRKACGDCRGQGLVWHEGADSRKFELACLQDRPRDEYQVRKLR
ncbi:MAG: histone deacetylase [Desulfobacterales bacterium]